MYGKINRSNGVGTLDEQITRVNRIENIGFRMKQIEPIAQKTHRQRIAIYLRPTMDIPRKIQEIRPLQNNGCGSNEEDENYFESEFQAVE